MFNFSSGEDTCSGAAEDGDRKRVLTACPPFAGNGRRQIDALKEMIEHFSFKFHRSFIIAVSVESFAED